MSSKGRRTDHSLSDGYDPKSKVQYPIQAKKASQTENGDGQMRTYSPPTQSLVIVCLLLASVCMGSMTATALQIGEKAPVFTLASTTDETISLNQYKGKKLVLIQFYSTDFNPT
jgi:hypothetical protein